MCGEPLARSHDFDSHEIDGETDGKDQERSRLDRTESVVDSNVIESVLIEEKSFATIWLILAAGAFVLCGAALVFKYPSSREISFIPTETGVPPTLTYTPSWTPLPTETPIPSETSTITLTPEPTDTPREPRSHTVAAGETLFGLGLRYGVSSESIASLNGLAGDAGLVVSQQLIIPWPTATPPLVPVQVEIAGQVLVADPTDCVLYEIKRGDTLLGVASRNRVDYRALLAVNRLTEQSILQPGDAICIPKIIRGGVLPPNPGPSPTASSTPPLPGPDLLLPLPNSEFDASDDVITFQWVAVKDLEPDEWYMVEITNLSAVDVHPYRGFTRQTAFRFPDEWRPGEQDPQLYRWSVRIIVVTGTREDGGFTYTAGGSNSEDAYFYLAGSDS